MSTQMRGGVWDFFIDLYYAALRMAAAKCCRLGKKADLSS
jgi:hypothetical protein